MLSFALWAVRFKLYTVHIRYWIDVPFVAKGPGSTACYHMICLYNFIIAPVIIISRASSDTMRAFCNQHQFLTLCQKYKQGLLEYEEKQKES